MNQHLFATVFLYIIIAIAIIAIICLAWQLIKYSCSITTTLYGTKEKRESFTSTDTNITSSIYTLMSNNDVNTTSV